MKSFAARRPVHHRVGYALSAFAMLATFGVGVAGPAVGEPKPQTETEIKEGCSAAGGSYATTVVGGKNGTKPTRFSQCTFSDIDGDTYTDSYRDGNFIGQIPGSCGGAKCGPA